MALAVSSLAAQPVDYGGEIRPILEENYLDCHGPEKQKSGLRVGRRAIWIRGGDAAASTTDHWSFQPVVRPEVPPVPPLRSMRF